jgi:hypothetical protein
VAEGAKVAPCSAALELEGRNHQRFVMSEKRKGKMVGVEPF